MCNQVSAVKLPKSVRAEQPRQLSIIIDQASPWVVQHFGAGVLQLLKKQIRRQMDWPLCGRKVAAN
jgi:hypothetical protein